jgi:hypothetical protein
LSGKALNAGAMVNKINWHLLKSAAHQQVGTSKNLAESGVI